MAKTNTNVVVHRTGCTFLGFLGLAFIVLKLCGVINWHWLWVLAPLWAPFAFWLSVIIGAAILGGALLLIGLLCAWIFKK